MEARARSSMWVMTLEIVLDEQGQVDNKGVSAAVLSAGTRSMYLIILESQM